MTLSQNNLRGIWTAIVTPFSANSDAIDFDSLKSLIAYQVSGGVDGLVACGSTGEASTLNEEEYFSVITFSLGQLKGKLPCIAGLNCSNTSKAIDIAKKLEQLKVDGILLTCPAYNKPSQEGLYRHFCAVKSAVSLPIIAYNIPGRTSVNMLPSTVARLAQEGAIIGIKESSTIDQILDLISLCQDKISILSGDDSLALSSVASGGQGVVSVTSNLAPAYVSTMIKTTLSGSIAEATKFQKNLIPLMRALFG